MTEHMFNGYDLATAWLSVSVASGKDEARPVLDRTVSIECYPEGVRLVATDSVVLLRSWVPDREHELDEPEPGPDEKPYATAVAIDEHGRAKGFLSHVLKLAAVELKADREPPDVRVRLGVLDDDDFDRFGADLTFPGMEALYVVLDLPDQERLKMTTFEGDYPAWQRVVTAFRSEKTERVALNPEVVGRLAKLGKWHGNKPLGWTFGGDVRAAYVEVLESCPRVEGVVMPCRWDFDRDTPREDDTEDTEQEGDES